MRICFLIVCLFSQLVFAEEIVFKIVEIEPGSLYSKLNLKKDDIVKEINGNEIKSLNEYMNISKDPTLIKNITILRKNKKDNLFYKI